MNWSNHPTHLRARERIVRAARSGAVQKFRQLSRIVFLCGAGGPTARRNTLREYLIRQRRDCLAFYADDVWLDLHNRGFSALEIEHWLADLSDVVIIVTESAGALAELGAFSMNPELRQKLLLVLDEQYRGAPSFINTGPVAWTDKTSKFAPSIYVPFSSSILRCTGAVEDRLNRIARPSTKTPADILKSHKHLIFFVSDIASIAGPVASTEVEWYLNEIAGGLPNLPLDVFLSLARSMKLLEKREIDGVTYFLPSKENQELRGHTRQKYFNVANLRADYVGAMSSVEAFREVLRKALA